jgi:hypothetical protein
MEVEDTQQNYHSDSEDSIEYLSDIDIEDNGDNFKNFNQFLKSIDNEDINNNEEVEPQNTNNEMINNDNEMNETSNNGYSNNEDEDDLFIKQTLCHYPTILRLQQMFTLYKKMILTDICNKNNIPYEIASFKLYLKKKLNKNSRNEPEE